MVVLRHWAWWLVLLTIGLLPNVSRGFSPRIGKRPPTLRPVSQWAVGMKRNGGGTRIVHEDQFHVQEFSGENDDDEDVAADIGKDSTHFNDKEWMFFDVARLNVRGGDGGDGCMAMRREFCVEHGGPSGGNGGNGGSVFLECDKNLNTLAVLRRRVHYRGRDGTSGRGDSRHGYKGDDVVIPVPPGTIVRDQHGALAGELNNHGDRMVVARGGRGGRGNEHFKTPRMNAPNFAEKGELGGERWIQLELKLIADVGLVGVPNAGKSTLLAAVSNAKPKIADYPFTTVVPNLGVCDLFVDEASKGQIPSSASSLVLADIPGLLEGAHVGVGLGMAFLRHIQRCRVLIHVIRGDSPDPLGDFLAINQELALFNPRLANKTQVVVINKIDIPEVADKVDELLPQLQRLAGHTRIVPISAATRVNVRELMMRVSKLVQNLPAQSAMELFVDDDEETVNFELEDGDGGDGIDPRKTRGRLPFEILKDPAYPGQFRVAGHRIERIVQMTNWAYYGSTLRFQRIMEAHGISKALENVGAKQGDLVLIGDHEFDFWDPKNRWMANLGMADV